MDWDFWAFFQHFPRNTDKKVNSCKFSGWGLGFWIWRRGKIGPQQKIFWVSAPQAQVQNYILPLSEQNRPEFRRRAFNKSSKCYGPNSCPKPNSQTETGFAPISDVELYLWNGRSCGSCAWRVLFFANSLLEFHCRYQEAWDSSAQAQVGRAQQGVLQSSNYQICGWREVTLAKRGPAVSGGLSVTATFPSPYSFGPWCCLEPRSWQKHVLSGWLPWDVCTEIISRFTNRLLNQAGFRGKEGKMWVGPWVWSPKISQSPSPADSPVVN